MLTVAVKYSPRLSAAEQELAALPDRIAHLDQFARIGLEPITVAMLRRHWETRGAAFGHPWPPLKPSTVESRIRKGTFNKGPLRDTDKLYTAVFAPSARRIVSTQAGVRLLLAPNDPKWLFHQLGTRRMAQRQPIPDPLPRPYVSNVRDAVADFLETGRLRGAAGRFIAFTTTGAN